MFVSFFLRFEASFPSRSLRNTHFPKKNKPTSPQAATHRPGVAHTSRRGREGTPGAIGDPKISGFSPSKPRLSRNSSSTPHQRTLSGFLHKNRSDFATKEANRRGSKLLFSSAGHTQAAGEGFKAGSGFGLAPRARAVITPGAPLFSNPPQKASPKSPTATKSP